MVDKELLEAIGQLMDVKLQPITERLDRLESRMDSLESRVEYLETSQEEIRSGVNSLLEWAEVCSNVVKLPLPRIK